MGSVPGPVRVGVWEVLSSLKDASASVLDFEFLTLQFYSFVSTFGFFIVDHPCPDLGVGA